MFLSLKDRQKLHDYFVHRPVKKVFLFGSYARGTAELETSDVDLLVELDYSKPIGFEFVQMVLDLQKILGTQVDLVTTDGVSRHILPFIEPDKQLIYERAA